MWMPKRYDPQFDFDGLKILQEEDINDKSKQDWLAKGFVLAQTIWFVTQCIARRVLHLALTELELTACAYAVLSAVTYGFWWKKPFNIGRPNQAIREPLEPPEPPGEWKDKLDDFRKLLIGVAYDEINFERRSRVPTFYSGRLSPYRSLGVFIAEVVCAVIFGGIHLIAWNFIFPSHVEQIMWRVSATIVATIPIMWVFAALLAARPLAAAAAVEAAAEAAAAATAKNKPAPRRWAWYETAPTRYYADLDPDLDPDLQAAKLEAKRAAKRATAPPPAADVVILLYILARFILLAISFSSLRALPPGAFVVVHWTTFIPHFS